MMGPNTILNTAVPLKRPAPSRGPTFILQMKLIDVTFTIPALLSHSSFWNVGSIELSADQLELRYEDLWGFVFPLDLARTIPQTLDIGDLDGEQSSSLYTARLPGA